MAFGDTCSFMEESFLSGKVQSRITMGKTWAWKSTLPAAGAKPVWPTSKGSAKTEILTGLF